MSGAKSRGPSMRIVFLIFFLLVYSLEAQEVDLENLKEAADGGDFKAEFRLGYMYSKGEDLPKNESEAIRWFRKSAAQDYPPAQYALGQRYFFGIGIDKDLEEAVKWMKLAASERASEGPNSDGPSSESLQRNTFPSESEDVNVTKSHAFQRIPSVQGDLITSQAGKELVETKNYPETENLELDEQEITGSNNVPTIDSSSATRDIDIEENKTFQGTPSASGDFISNIATSDKTEDNSPTPKSSDSVIPSERDNVFIGLLQVEGDTVENLASQSRLGKGGVDEDQEIPRIIISLADYEKNMRVGPQGPPGPQGDPGSQGPPGIAGKDGSFSILSLCLALGVTYLIVTFLRDLIRRLLLERKIRIGDNLFIKWKKD